MIDNSKKNDIRVLKYEEYVKKHPKKAYGYYCLGRLHLMLENYKTAQEYFQKSLSINPEHTLSKISLTEVYVFRRKFLKAVSFFSKHRQDIIRKYIFRLKLVRGVSSFYRKSDLFTMKSQGLIASLFLKYTMYYAADMVKKESQNIVLKLLLSMHYLSTNERNPFVNQIFKTCVYWDGLDDLIRWELLKSLSETGEKLFYDVNIARKFSNIPVSDCSAEYANIIFGASLLNGSRKKIVGIYNSAGKFDIKLSPNMLWSYINWSKENLCYDNSVYDCCKRLVKTGWVDRLVAETMIKMREKKSVSFTDEDERVLKLYGYLS